MKIAVGFDHYGVALRTIVITELMSQGHEVLDLGTDRFNPEVDYVAKAHDVAAAILSGNVERGVLVSRSGVGSSFAANKIEGIRACACSDVYTAHRSVDVGMNVVCLGSSIVSKRLAAEIVDAFVGPYARRWTLVAAHRPLGLSVGSG